MKEKFTWQNFYYEFAKKLLEYKDKSNELVDVIHKVFAKIDKNVPQLYYNNMLLPEIDPFTIYGLFNKQQSLESKKQIIKGFIEVLNIEAFIPEDFDALPVINNMMACFYGWGSNWNDNAISNLWKIFECAYYLSMNDIKELREQFIQLFDVVTKQFAVRWNITFGLFWAFPNYFVSLDQYTKSYLLNDADYSLALSEIYPGIKRDYLPSGKEYLDLCDLIKERITTDEALPYKNLIELSYVSWEAGESRMSKASFIQYMVPIVNALKKLGGSAKVKNVKAQIIQDMSLTEEVLSETRGKTGVNKFDNEVAFARNYLVYGGYIDKSVRGVWSLTEKGQTEDLTLEKASNLFKTTVKKTHDIKKEKNTSFDEEDSELERGVHYWLIAAGSSNEDRWEDFKNNGLVAISWNSLGLDDIRNYKTKEEIISKFNLENNSNISLAIWQFANEIEIGDIIFVKLGVKKVLAKGKVESDYIFDETRLEYKHIRKVTWLNIQENDYPENVAPQKTLTDITRFTELVNKLNALYENEQASDLKVNAIQPYGPDEFLDEVYIDQEAYEEMLGLLERKKNIILQGPPGVGKTYISKRLAYSIIGKKAIKQVKLIQFHQSYSYEDFVMGYRPTDDGRFIIKHGPFYEICEEARNDLENKYFLIIDEFNRGNTSKIFGELFMLIEADKRNSEIRLLYQNEQFSVPKNLYIIAMMNTADRSLTMIDYALRRRFGFYELKPAFNNDKFIAKIKTINNKKLTNLIEVIKLLNEEISSDFTLGSGFEVGHSYFSFSNDNIDDELELIVKYELIPLLNEYWLDDRDKKERWIESLKEALK